MHFIERVKNCHFANCYRVPKNIRFGTFSELSLLCERVNPKDWKICKYSLKMNNYYPYLYIIYGMFGVCMDVDKIGHYTNFFHMLNGDKARKPLRRKGYRRPPYKYIIPKIVYDCPLKYREFLKKVLGK